LKQQKGKSLMDRKLATVVKEGVKPKWSTEAQQATNKQADSFE
jgi:hypothetical protein